VQDKKPLIAILATVITSMVFMNIGNTTPATAQEPGGTVVRDSSALLLSGHVAAKIPCDDESNSTLTLLTGSAPDFQPAELELVQNLSTPGELCLYHVDLPQEGVNVTTDLAIQNPGEEDVEFPDTSTIVIGINEIMAGAEEHG
jgi:hypothetical protein